MGGLGTLLGSPPEEGLPWGVLLLFGGGLSQASAVAASGLDGWMGSQVTGLGVLPAVMLIPAAFAATCAFMLPVGTPPNAIVFGTGAVTIAQMARGSFVLNFVGIALITGFCYFLGGIALGLKY